MAILSIFSSKIGMSHSLRKAQFKGTLVDDGALYLSIGFVEVMLLCNRCQLDEKIYLDLIFEAISEHAH